MNTSDNSISGEASTLAARRRPQPVQWDVVFFKVRCFTLQQVDERDIDQGLILSQVEEITFPVSPHRLIENSEFFARMFHLPTSENQRAEGRDKEHPIMLEGYQASEFHALLRILYPT
jgi:hypothetical protein